MSSLVVKSPGVSWRERARRRQPANDGIPVWSEVELGYRLLPGARFIGVTGTNGKTTTVELLGAMFQAAARSVVVAGNVGRPLTAVEPAEWIVCELSSFQLEDVHELTLEIAVLLNLEPDHLDRHASVEAYRDAKLRIFERARTAIVPRGLGLAGIEFSREDPLPAEPRIPGAHNRENAAAATAAARAAGVADDAIARALRDFPGVEHRLELVAELRGVRYVNDSKATNTAAARRALEAYDAPLHVILGGSLKGEDFGPLAETVRDTGCVRAVYLIGEAADEIERALQATAVPRERCGRPSDSGRARSRQGSTGRDRAAVARVRELRPISRLRASRRGVSASRAEPEGVKRAQLEANVLILVTLGLVAFGLVMVYSATSARATVGDGEPMYYLTRQAIFALAGLAALVVCARTPYAWWRRAAPTLLAVTILLLAAVLVLGDPVNGARRWLPLGPFVFQPSEAAKLALAVWTAAYLSRSRTRPPTTLGELAKPLGLVTGVSAGLILLEPDLGTAIAVVLMLGGILVAAGAPVSLLARGGAIVVFLGAAAIWLEPYRRERILSFFNPWSDAQGAGFQSVQALIGLGSGGVLGKGIGEGVQKIFYLPEAHTDMIFATIGEELGLIGTVGVIAAFAAFCWAGMRIAVACPDRFGSLLAAGLTVLIGAQAATNLAAVLGLAPVTGITLPFVSYGGSSLVVALAGAGILLNIAGTDARAKRAEVPDRSRGDRRPRAAVARSGGGIERPRSTRDVRRVAGSRRSATRP